MFIGHAALALAARPLAPRANLGVALAATYWLDLVWPMLVLAGVERVEIDPGNTAFTPLDFIHYPFTHSFAGVLFWALLFGGVYFALKRDTRSSLLLGALGDERPARECEGDFKSRDAFLAASQQRPKQRGQQEGRCLVHDTASLETPASSASAALPP